ncbi:cbb3-type cytochrome c oxidase subunit II [Desulfosporosinus sp. SYSU MS00001]|uniref:cbb3-type cytochrome c oxidase subunit II n=1 Tax=Desulfosporosinus sp. SYSU MS00001 TaxID=3416284 RepID=UPI003CEDEC19
MLKFEKHLGHLLFGFILFFSFAVVTTYIIPEVSAQGIKETAETVHYTPQQAQGRQIYMSEGCNWCHTQEVRTGEENSGTVFRRGDIGEVTLPSWYAAQNPLLIEQHRRGPDLSHVWTRWPSVTWQKTHLENPEQLNPGTWMPPFSYLSDNDLNNLIAYLQTLK